MVQVTLEATSSELLELKIQEYFTHYHPCGYGTWVKHRWCDDNGKHYALILRGSSCD